MSAISSIHTPGAKTVDNHQTYEHKCWKYSLEFIFCETVFYLWKASIECWILLPTLHDKMNRRHIQNLLT